MQEFDRLNDLVDPAFEALQRALKPGARTKDELLQARIANTALGHVLKSKQIDQADKKFRFNVARELAEDKEQLAAYLEVSTPKLVGASSRKLPAPKKK